MLQFNHLIATYQGKLLLTAAIVGGLWLIRYIILKILNRGNRDIHRKIVNQQISGYIAILAAIALIIPLWLHWFQTVFAVVSVIAVAIVLVTKDLLVNLLAHAVIVWRGLFSVGDRIKIQEYVGNVVQIGPMYLTLAEIGTLENEGCPTGRIIKLPNNLILTSPVVNYSRGIAIIWSELKVHLDPACNWKKARVILSEIGERYNAKVDESDIDNMLIAVEEAMSIHSSPSTSVRLEDGVITLRLRYSYRLDSKVEFEQNIWDDILSRFEQEEDINIVRP